MMRRVLVVFASMDPRGNKIGGIETHIRHILRNHPPEVDLVLAGLDEAGDLALGQPLAITFGGRALTFLPLAHVPAEEARQSAAKLAGSTTLRLVLGGIRHLGALKSLTRGRPASADIPRVEFAILPMLMGLPFALTVHSDLAKAAKTDSLLKRYRGLKQASERLAFRAARHVFVVSDAIRDQLVADDPALAGKCDVMTVPVDTKLFAPSPFPAGTPFRVIYAGRFDEVKDPRLMFSAVAALHAQLGDALEFHVIGAADPESFAEFAPIRTITRRHGPQNAEGVARIIREAHCGLITSHSEGMPCFLLETLASGRAFVAVDLPSFVPLVRAGFSGRLVARAGSREDTAGQLAAALLVVRDEIASGRILPDMVAASVAPYSVASVFARLFGLHQRLAGAESDVSEAASAAA